MVSPLPEVMLPLASYVKVVLIHPAGDGGDAVRLGLAGRRVAVGADIGLEGDVADGVVGNGLHPRGGAEAHRRLGEPVERVVFEALGERGVGIAARQQPAQQVVGVGVPVGLAGVPRRDVGKLAGVGVEGLMPSQPRRPIDASRSFESGLKCWTTMVSRAKALDRIAWDFQALTDASNHLCVKDRIKQSLKLGMNFGFTEFGSASQEQPDLFIPIRWNPVLVRPRALVDKPLQSSPDFFVLPVLIVINSVPTKNHRLMCLRHYVIYAS
jgi:hypothetical protein